MKPPELFGVIVRTFGFFIIIWGGWTVLAGISTYVEMAMHTHHASDYSALGYLLMGIPEIALGVFCFFCADWIVRLTYRDK